MRIKVILFLIFCFISAEGLGQKIKYKDLFVLLNAKRYEEAEPYLKLFLKDDKNDDHANAHLQMGNIYHDKVMKADVLGKDNNATVFADSAIHFYEKAITFIDDREVRKNDEYYEAYTRRDLRTGKVGINLSDIHFDLKKRIEQLNTRNKLVRNLRNSYKQFTNFYTKAAELTSEIKSSYSDNRTLLLRGDESLIQSLEMIKANYDSAEINFTKYRKILDEDQSLGYNQQWEENEFEIFTSNLDTVDFKADEFIVYNLGRWAEDSKNIIETEIKPLKQHVLEYDKALDALYKKIATDSVSVRSDVTVLAQRMLTQQLEKYDRNPLPVQLFRLRLAELDYLSDLMDYKQNRDSADANYQLKMVSEQLGEIKRMDSLVNILIGMNLQEEAVNYDQYVRSRYGSAGKMQDFVKSKLDFVIEESRRLEKLEEERRERLNWMAFEDDRIPIILTDTLSYYRPVQVIGERYSVGLRVDSSRIYGGYFTDINPARVSKIKVDIDLDSTIYNSSAAHSTDILSTSDQEDKIFYVVIVQPSDDITTFNAAVSKIYAVNGISWTNNFQLPSMPSGLYYQPDTGDLVINMNNEEDKIIITKEGILKEGE